MGDIADDLIDQMIEHGMWGKPRRRSSGVTCRHCKARWLWWLPEKRGRYRLMNADGSKHDCRAPASAEEFEKLE